MISLNILEIRRPFWIIFFTWVKCRATSVVKNWLDLLPLLQVFSFQIKEIFCILNQKISKEMFCLRNWKISKEILLQILNRKISKEIFCTSLIERSQKKRPASVSTLFLLGCDATVSKFTFFSLFSWKNCKCIICIICSKTAQRWRIVS